MIRSYQLGRLKESTFLHINVPGPAGYNLKKIVLGKGCSAKENKMKTI